MCRVRLQKGHRRVSRLPRADTAARATGSPLGRLSGAALPLAALLMALGAACSGGDDGAPTDTAGPGPVCVSSGLAPTGLVAPLDPQTELEAIVLRDEDVPDLQRSSLTFSSNEDLADSAQDPEAELAKLEQLGRQLGVDVAFLPDANTDSPVKGGIQSSVSIYQTADGASQSLQESIAEARQTDWEVRYPELTRVRDVEITRPIGDESAWFRITGRDPAGLVVIDDQVVFRAGRTRAFVRVVSQFADETALDPFIGEVAACAGIVVERAQAVLEG